MDSWLPSSGRIWNVEARGLRRNRSWKSHGKEIMEWQDCLAYCIFTHVVAEYTQRRHVLFCHSIRQARVAEAEELVGNVGD